MGERIDIDEFTPAYFQLARILNGKIMRGELRPGDRIPTEEQLVREYGLSRMTVRRSIAMLAEKGLVRSVRGKGTFVLEPRVEGGLFLIPDFHEEMRNQGLVTQARLLKVNVTRAGSTAAERLGIKKGERVIYLERILEGGGEPLVLDRKYILFDKSIPLLEAEIGHGSIAELFSDCPELIPVKADLSLSVTALKPREARLLNGKQGEPAFLMEQLIYAANNRKVIWGWLIYRGDRFSFKSLSRPL